MTMPCDSSPPGVRPSARNDNALGRMTLLRVRVVDSLGVRQWQAELVPVDSAAMVRRAGGRLRRDAVADQIPQVLPLEEELASALLDQLRPDRRRPRAREGPETRTSAKR